MITRPDLRHTLILNFLNLTNMNARPDRLGLRFKSSIGFMTNQSCRLALCLAATGLAAFPSDAWAGDGDFGALLEIIFISPIVAIIVTWYLPTKRIWLKALLFFPVLAACVVATGTIFISLQETKKRQENAAFEAKSKAIHQAKVAAFDSDPIVLAACSVDVAQVKTLTNGTVSNEQQARYGEILERCGFGDEPARAEIFVHLMAKIMALQESRTQKSANAESVYCDVLLRRVYSERRMAYLQAMVNQQLPITCHLGDGAPVWWGTVEQGITYDHMSQPTVSTLALLSYLQNNGVALGAKGGDKSSGTLINLVIRGGSFDLVTMGLNAGGETDLYSRSTMHGLYNNAPIAQWTVRRFKAKNLTEQQIQAIQSKFGDISSEQVNSAMNGDGDGSGPNLLWGLESFNTYPNNSAEFFAYLVSRGVDLSARDQFGGSALYRLRSTSDALLAELDKLSPTQFNALVSPIDGPNSLLEAAKRMNNIQLAHYLCTKKGAKC
jgi:hypothetical protein